MKDQIYLVFTKKGVEKMYKTRRVNLRGGQHAAKLTVKVPDEYFRSPMPEATVTIGREQMMVSELGVTVEDPETGEEKQIADPGEYVEHLAKRVRGGDTVERLPEWAYHALRGKLEGWGDRIDHGLREVDGEAVYYVERADT